MFATKPSVKYIEFYFKILFRDMGCKVYVTLSFQKNDSVIKQLCLSMLVTSAAFAFKQMTLDVVGTFQDNFCICLDFL